jgi:hypothetical protein
MLSNTPLRFVLITLVLLSLTLGVASAQGRPASPKGSASTQIGDAWIDVSYSRPILRGRQGIFGSGAEYGQKIYAGAPLWRVGADVTTRITTEADLEIGGTKVPAGEYSLFIELKEGAWTAVISKQPYMATFDRAKIQEGQTWGAYGYNPEHDVAKAPMTVTTNENSLDQMTILFSNVSADGGSLVVAWDNQIGRMDFKVAK